MTHDIHGQRRGQGGANNPEGVADHGGSDNESLETVNDIKRALMLLGVAHFLAEELQDTLYDQLTQLVSVAARV